MRSKVLLILILLTVSHHQLFALGIGAYSKSSIGYSTLSKLDYTTGFGLVLDTVVAKPSRFNYRLNIGYETYGRSGSEFFSEKAWHRVTSNNTFGYALFVNEYLRVWLGPRLSLACQFDIIKERGDYTSLLMQSGINVIESRDYRKYVLGIASLGVVVGLNFNIGDTVTIGIETGLSAGMSIGMVRRDSYYTLIAIYPPFGNDTTILPSRGTQDELTNGFFEFQVQLSVLFRVGDHSIRTNATKVESIQR